MVNILFCLVNIPPLAYFAGKFLFFGAAIDGAYKLVSHGCDYQQYDLSEGVFVHYCAGVLSECYRYSRLVPDRFVYLELLPLLKG